MGIIPTGGTGIHHHHHHHHHHHLYHGAGLDGACRRGWMSSAPGLARLTPSSWHTIIIIIIIII
jgi:hypothetical protein